MCVRRAWAMKPNEAPPGSPWRRNFPCSCGELGQPSRGRSGYCVCNFSLSMHWELLHPRSCPSQGSHTQPLSIKALPLSSQDTPVDKPRSRSSTWSAKAVSGLCCSSRSHSFPSQASILSKLLAPRALSQYLPPKSPTFDTCYGTCLYDDLTSGLTPAPGELAQVFPEAIQTPGQLAVT